MESNYFLIQQLVPPDIYQALGEKAWDLLKPDAVTTLDQLYDYFGPMTVNNWHTGGRFKESGLRDVNSPTGAPLSQHKLGNAFDCKPLKITPQAMHATILANADKFPLLTTLEDIASTPTWVHFDCRPITVPRIRIVKP